MSHPRLYPRVRPSGQMSSEAKIFVTGKSPTINCKVVDYSKGRRMPRIVSDGGAAGAF